MSGCPENCERKTFHKKEKKNKKKNIHEWEKVSSV